MSSSDGQTPPTEYDAAGDTPSDSSPFARQGNLDSSSALDDQNKGDSYTHASESVEQYLRLNEHIERLRAEQRPTRPEGMTEDEASIYQMAAFFHAAAPGAATPDDAFASALLLRLEDEARLQREASQASNSPHESAPAAAVTTTPGAVRRGSGVSRRGLLTGGLSAAAAAVVGVATGAAYERKIIPSSNAAVVAAPLVPEGAGVWTAVASVEAIPLGAVQHFQTDFIVGYVRHTAEGFSALSGVCTHMGCFLHWNEPARTFDCPCHNGQFTENGVAAPSSRIPYTPLPPIQTKVENGQVWVYVIPPTSAAPNGSPGRRRY